AAFALTGLADLQETLPGLCEFENHRVIAVSNGSAGLLFVLHLFPARATSARSRRCADAVAADPDVALGVDRDSLIGFRPIVALTPSTPTRQQVALLVVVQNRRRRRATLRNRWIGRCVQLTLLERPRAMDDPDVVFVVDRHSNGLAQQPMVRQRLRPQRIDFESRGLDTRSFDSSSLLQYAARRQQQRQHYDKQQANAQITLHAPSFPG